MIARYSDDCKIYRPSQNTKPMKGVFYFLNYIKVDKLLSLFGYLH
jgi:hypothetical protein